MVRYSFSGYSFFTHVFSPRPSEIDSLFRFLFIRSSFLSYIFDLQSFTSFITCYETHQSHNSFPYCPPQLILHLQPINVSTIISPCILSHLRISGIALIKQTHILKRLPTLLQTSLLSFSFKQFIIQILSVTFQSYLKIDLYIMNPLPLLLNIFVVLLFQHQFVTQPSISCMHATPIAEHMGEYKTLCRIRLRCFGLDYILMFLNGSRSVLTECSRIVGSEGGKK